MSFVHWVLVYIASLAAFLLIDMIWLGVIARGMYRTQIGHLLADTPNWTAAFVFYALFVLGIMFFAVSPAVAADSWGVLIRNGAFFGLITYATYDLTSLAVMKNFPASIALIDMAWGTVLVTSVSAIAYRVAAAL